jgi:hypothetical protein
VLHSNSSLLFTLPGTITVEPNSNKHLKSVKVNKLAHYYACILKIIFAPQVHVDIVERKINKIVLKTKN